MKSPGVGAGISPALAAAQRRLDELRQQHQCSHQNPGQTAFLAHGRAPLPQKKAALNSATLPDHLGWHSPAVTRVLRQANRSPTAAPAALPASQPVSTALAHSSRSAGWKLVPDNNPALKLQPDLALAMLRQGQAAVGRVWLLLRHLDRPGKGWIELGDARQALTTAASPLRICGWRQLRNLLAQGEGLFWRRGDGRIWLAGTTRVAAALGIQRLVSPPVALTVSQLCAPMGDVRAHFYASFHSSRTCGRQQASARPIARTTLEKLTHTSRHTLRAYERRSGVRRQVNFAVGPATQSGQEQEQAWQHGRALFAFTDHKGLLGRPLVTHTAWQLPNSYYGPHMRLPRGSQKQLNQQIADLSMKGMTGNGERSGQSAVSDPSPGPRAQVQPQRRFFDSGAAAARKYGKDSQSDLYWPRPQARVATYQLWHMLPGDSGRHKDAKWRRK